MSSSEPFFKAVPTPFPEDIKNEEGLHGGPADQPDFLPDDGEPEADLESALPHRDLPLRKPDIGEKLTAEQLAAELGGDSDS
jgi:hypothetical protein